MRAGPPASIQSIDGTLSRDPGNTGDPPVPAPGLLMGKVTSSGKYAPAILGVTTNAEAIGSTPIEASAAVVTELVRRVGASGTFTPAAPPANGVIDSQTVTYSAASGTAITCTALTRRSSPGRSSSRPTARTRPRPSSRTGTASCTDEDEASVDREFGPLPVKGIIDSSQLLPVWPSDTAAELDQELLRRPVCVRRRVLAIGRRSAAPAPTTPPAPPPAWRLPMPQTAVLTNNRPTVAGTTFCVSYYFTGTLAATDTCIFVAPRACRLVAATEVHSVAAGGASALQVVKDTSTSAPAGTDLLQSTGSTSTAPPTRRRPARCPPPPRT